MPAERRSGGELTATGRRLSGYALLYGVPYPVAGGPSKGGFTEVIGPDAASRAVREGHDVRLLVNHAGTPLARTRSGTLTLTSDSKGLRVDAVLDDSSPDAASVIAALRRGDMDQMSFAFRVPPGGDRWSADGSTRTVDDMDLMDVSVVTYPANAATVVGVRSETPPTPTRTGTTRPPTSPQRLRAYRYSTRGRR